MRQSPIRLAAIRITGEGWEVLEGRAHGGWPIIAVRKAIMLKSGAILGGLDRRWRRRGGKARCGWEKAGSCRCFGELPMFAAGSIWYNGNGGILLFLIVLAEFLWDGCGSV